MSFFSSPQYLDPVMDPSHREHYSVGPLNHLATSSSSLTFPVPPLPIPLYTLSVCFFLELGPTHWCLLIREPGAHRGFVHHVTGTPLEMEYWAIPDARPEDALKEATVYEVATFPGERLDDVRRVLEALPVPKAAMRDRYKRNCQDWVVEALEKLGEEGIIDDEPGREYRSKIEKKG